MNQTKTTKSKLPPLDFTEEVDKFESFGEKKTVKFENCKHKNVKAVPGGLRCPCGASWSGERMSELFDFFTKRK